MSVNYEKNLTNLNGVILYMLKNNGDQNKNLSISFRVLYLPMSYRANRSSLITVYLIPDTVTISS